MTTKAKWYHITTEKIRVSATSRTRIASATNAIPRNPRAGIFGTSADEGSGSAAKAPPCDRVALDRSVREGRARELDRDRSLREQRVVEGAVGHLRLLAHRELL